MENIIGLKEFRAGVSKVAGKIVKGESFIVVKRSKPLFRLSSVNEEENWQTLIDFTKIKKGGVPIEEIISAIANERSTKGHRKTTKRV